MFAQECPDLIAPGPLDGDVDVSVNPTIVWEAVDGVPGYIIQLGTVPGGTDILEVSVGSATSFTPPLGLPENTEVFVTIILDFLFDAGDDIVCPSLSFTTEDVTSAPECTTFVTPIDGATDVSVFTNFSWLFAPTATSYQLRIGTTPGGAEIFNGNVGNVLTFNPLFELPEGTTFFASIIPENENGTPRTCPEITFTTGVRAVIPGCTTLISPANGATNVALTPFVEWVEVPNATGYRITIGTTPGGIDVLNETDFIGVTSTFVLDFPPNRTFFVTIIPFNESGFAFGCQQESFSTIIGCGPFLDPVTGEFVDLNPVLTLPDTLLLCLNDLPLTVVAPDAADGYRWLRLLGSGPEQLLSATESVNLTEQGTYRYEAFNLVTAGDGSTFECLSSQLFTLDISETATIDNLIEQTTGNTLQITVEVSGTGDYEFAINDSNGPYQNSNVFSGLPRDGSFTFFVRDRNGCGIVSEDFQSNNNIGFSGFPTFFTPNGDQANDFWQYVPPLDGLGPQITLIRIYNRFGQLVAQIDPNSVGWDGRLNGRRLPSSDYWFQAIDTDNREIQGHFSLKR